jgi:hypothetical protein
LSGKLSMTGARVTTWPEQAIWALDQWLRERQGIYEYTDHAECVFRIQRTRAPRPFDFSDGTRVRGGDPIIGLHLWNEHIPVMGRSGPTLLWARRTLRALDTSLRELARFLQRRAEYADVKALYGNMCLGTPAQCEQLGRILRPYGFEVLSGHQRNLSESLHGLGQNILTAMLVLATNPASLRTALLRRYRERLILSRATLESHYGPGPTQRPASTSFSAGSDSGHRQAARRLCSTVRRRRPQHH